MPLFERYSAGHCAARVRTYDEGEVAKYRRLVEDADNNWREVNDPNVEKPLTPKERLQADAAALGLSTDGKSDEITARIDAHVAELLKQAAELEIDADKLTAVELAAAIDAKLASAS